jgi:hypothetical protein
LTFVLGRASHWLLGVAILLVMILGVLAGCGLSSSAEPSAEATPLPPAQPPITTTSTNTTTSTPRDQGIENRHCDDTQPYWWIEWGNDHGQDIGAYDTHCPGHRHPSWYAGVTRGEYQDPRHPDGGSPSHTGSSGGSSNTGGGSNHPTGNPNDPYGCQADIDAGLSMAQNRCGNVHLDATETDVESPSQMRNPASVWELCHMLASPGTVVYRKYCH